MNLPSGDLAPTQQTQNRCITFIQFWPNAFDVGSTLHKCYTNVLYLPGTPVISERRKRCYNADTTLANYHCLLATFSLLHHLHQNVTSQRNSLLSALYRDRTSNFNFDNYFDLIQGLRNYFRH